MDKLTAYNILQVNQNATQEEVKASYLALATKYAPENYEAGPLREDAAKKMEELNEAFDTVMSLLRTGSTNVASIPVENGKGVDQDFPVGSDQQAPRDSEKYAMIRQLIRSGKAQEAMRQLNEMAHGSNDAEWNFLMGSAYYYQGWLNEALQYFETACLLDPGNPEYEAAKRNLANKQNGEMPGNPYAARDAGATTVDCACRACTMMVCLDMCCGGCRRM